MLTQTFQVAGGSGRQAQTVLAVDISELDTKLVSVKEGTKRYGNLYQNTSGMA